MFNKIKPILFITVMLPLSVLAIGKWEVFEMSFKSSKDYENPFIEVQTDVVFEKDGREWKQPAFWDGEKKWTVRFAFPVTGTFTYRVESNDPALNQEKGTVDVDEYKGDNFLIQRGHIRVSNNRRYFEHADGTPFFWLGDTWWKGMCKRITWEGYQKLTLDRKKKGFTVIQTIIGPYPDEPEFDTRWENEGGMPYDKSYTRINPEYFRYADQRIEYLVHQGLVPAIFGAWGYHIGSIGVENMSRFWRYLIARYGAYPVFWVIGGEVFKGPKDMWIKTAEYVRSIDPYHRPTTLHSDWVRGSIPEELLDFDMMMPGQGGSFSEMPPLGDWKYTTLRTAAMVQAAYAIKPLMPVVIGEICYEDHMMTNGVDLQRQVFWSSILSGARGFTYGAEGLWQMNSEKIRGSEYSFTPWFEAMNFRGSTQIGLGKKLLEKYPWWRMEPHSEWIESHATIFNTPPDKNWDHLIAEEEFIKSGGRWDLPYAAGIPNELRIIYIPGRYYDWTCPTIKGLEENIPYHVYLFDPAQGIRYEIGLIMNIGNAEVNEVKTKKMEVLYSSVEKGLPLVMHDDPYNARVWAVELPQISFLANGDFKLERLPSPQDWVLVMERVKN
jgi:hypothetical protein